MNNDGFRNTVNERTSPLKLPEQPESTYSQCLLKYMVHLFITLSSVYHTLSQLRHPQIVLNYVLLELTQLSVGTLKSGAFLETYFTSINSVTIKTSKVTT